MRKPLPNDVLPPTCCPGAPFSEHKLSPPLALEAMPKKKTPRSIPHLRTRESHARETAEDYVEAVFEIIADLGQCRVGDLAKRFDVSHVTVSRIVKRLASELLLEIGPLWSIA